MLHRKMGLLTIKHMEGAFIFNEKRIGDWQYHVIIKKNGVILFLNLYAVKFTALVTELYKI